MTRPTAPDPRSVAASKQVRLSVLLWAAGLVLGLSLALTAGLRGQETTLSPHGQLANDCTDCHREEGWRPVRIRPGFDHAKLGFPLSGAHATAPCLSCHLDLTFANAATRCGSCHQDIHRGELGEDCSTCHTERTFLDRFRMFQLHQTTRFTLEGSHRAADCESCHPRAGQGGLQFVARPTDCQSCHGEEYAAARSPDHQAAGFSRDCNRCHAVTRWGAARFNHATGGFPITGAHRALACDQCHAGNQFGALPATCVSCHQQDYDATTTPGHASSGFSTDCVLCHSTARWEGASFNHGSRFPLTGAHKTASCAACHGDGTYAGKPTACEACHLPDFNGTTSPGHLQLGWPTTCTTCHSGSGNTTAWDRGVRLPTQYHSMFNANHEGAGGQCTQCHNTTDYRQSTCSNHHHPPSCTFLNQGRCDD